MEVLAEEIENPFGYDDNDLPTDLLAENIKIAVYGILKQK
jgi:putative membrane protein